MMLGSVSAQAEPAAHTPSVVHVECPRAALLPLVASLADSVGEAGLIPQRERGARGVFSPEAVVADAPGGASHG